MRSIWLTPRYPVALPGIPIDQLVVANEFRRSALLLNRTFQAVTVLETQGGRFFQLLVDLDSGQVEERATVEDAEARASNAKYGKFQPALYERLQQLKDTDPVTVTLVVAAGSGQSLGEREIAAGAALAAKYPEARAAIARHGKPMDVADPALAAQIYKEYVALIDGDLPQRIAPVVAALKAQGFAVRTTAGLPAVTVSIPKAVVLMLAQRGDIGTIFLAEAGPGHPTLDTATKTNRAPEVWSRGYDGSGVKIAILEDTNVDFTSPSTAQCSSSSNNCFLHPGAIRPAYTPPSSPPWHSTLVASAAASNNSTYKGMAPGATILSAGMYSSFQQDAADALDWALDPSLGAADVVNTSYGWCGGPYMTALDWAYDYYARTRSRLLVVAAGNNNNTGCNDNVITPGLGWNVLSVGASDNINDPDWSNDVRASFSAYLNPVTTNGDHEKPEVVAPGSIITGIGLDGQIVTPIPSGTSFSSPQVAGEAALLIHRNPQLRNWPEALRAIIMATATNNVDGPTGIPSGTDLKDGAGSINADLAYTTALVRNVSSSPCITPCWWGETVTANDFVAGTGYRYYQFNAQAGDRIRVAIAWDSYADCGGTLVATTASISINNCGDTLATDFQLAIFAPSGALLSGGYSASFDNSFEFVPPNGELTLPQTGTYSIGVYKKALAEGSNSLGVAWTKVPPDPNIYALNKADSPKTSVHILNALDNFQTYLLEQYTALGPTGTNNQWVFVLGDYNGDGKLDLYAINKADSPKTSVHILNGANNFQSFLLEQYTALGPAGTNSQWMFVLGDYNGDGKLDLYAINKADSPKTSVHILNGANNFQSFLLDKNTILGPTGTNSQWVFVLGDYNDDSKLDLYALNKTDSPSTSIHILNGANDFQSYLLEQYIGLGPTGSDSSWVFGLADYNSDGNPDLYAIKKTDSPKTSVHILNGANAFQTSLLDKSTALGPTGSDDSWFFLLGSRYLR